MGTYEYNDKSIPHLLRTMIKEITTTPNVMDGDTRVVCTYELQIGPFKHIQIDSGMSIPSDVCLWPSEWYSPRAICRELTRKLISFRKYDVLAWLKYQGLDYDDLRDAINCTASVGEVQWGIMVGGDHHGDVIAPPHIKFPTHQLDSSEVYYEDLQPNLVYRGCVVPRNNFHVRLLLHKSIPAEENLTPYIYHMMKEHPRVRAAVESGVVRYV